MCVAEGWEKAAQLAPGCLQGEMCRKSALLVIVRMMMGNGVLGSPHLQYVGNQVGLQDYASIKVMFL